MPKPIRLPSILRVLPLVLSFAATALANPAGGAAVGKWTFDEGEGTVARDTSGKDHHATVTSASWGDGESGKALVFAGPDYDGPFKAPGTFVTVDSSEKLNPTKALDLSVSVYPTFKPTGWGGIVEKGVGYGSSFRLLMLRSGKVRAAIGKKHLTVDSPDEIPLNVWTRLRMTFDGKSLVLFVNGKKVGEIQVAAAELSSEYPIEFGRRFTGLLDDVSLSY